MPINGAHVTIARAVMSWPGVTKHRHRFGGEEYRLGERREIGHVHGDAVVDIPVPIKLRDEWIAAGWAEPHQALPEIGAVSLFLREPADVDRAVELLRISFELAVEQKARGRQSGER
jgi:hypothetical protein